MTAKNINFCREKRRKQIIKEVISKLSAVEAEVRYGQSGSCLAMQLPANAGRK